MHLGFLLYFIFLICFSQSSELQQTECQSRYENCGLLSWTLKLHNYKIMPLFSLFIFVLENIIIFCKYIIYGFVYFKIRWKSLSFIWLFVTSWTIPSMEFSRPEYWSGVAFPFSRGSFQPRDWTHVSCTAVGFFTSWATKIVS